MFATLFVLLVVVILSSVNAALNATIAKLPTVPTLNVPQYLGLWYQVYADPAVVASFEKGTQCATAKYGDNGDGTLSVHNYATYTDTGTPYVSDGYAYQKDVADPGKLMVHFSSSDAFPFDAPYWVVSLGPVVNNQYDYAIVTDNLSLYLFVLTRDVATYYAKYDADVQKQLTAFGFSGLTKPVQTYHGSDCVYESTTRKAEMHATEQKRIAAEKAKK